MGRMRIQIDLDDAESCDAASPVHVVVRDTSQADVLHPTVAETTGTLAAGLAGDLTLDVPDRALAEQNSYSLFVHVDRQGRGEITAGDLITTHNIPVSTADIVEGAEPVTARVVPI